MSKRAKKRKSAVPPLDLNQIAEQLDKEISDSISIYLKEDEGEGTIQAIGELLQYHPELPELFHLRWQVHFLIGKMAGGAR
jgi:hypothetical protein